MSKVVFLCVFKDLDADPEKVQNQVLGVILYTQPSPLPHLAHFGVILKAFISCMCMWRWLGIQQKVTYICFQSGF